MKFLWRIAASALVFVVIYFISVYIFLPTAHSLAGRWQVSIEGKNEFTDVPFELKVKHPRMLVLTTKLKGQWGDTLVLPEVNGGGFEVYLNGKKIYQAGNMKNGAANIWSEMYSIPLSPYLLPRENTLKIKIFALYNAGISITPYVGWYSQIERKILLTEFFKSKIILIIMGMAIALGLVLISLAFMDDRNRKRYFVIGMSAFFMSVYLNDLQEWNVGSTLTYIILRKIFIISLYFSVFLFFDGMERNLFTELKASKPFLVATILVSLYVFAQPTAFQFKKSLIVGTLLSGIMMLIITIEVYLRKKYELVYPISLAVEIAIYVVVLALGGKPNAFLVPYAALSLIAGLGITLVKDYSRTYSNMLVSHKAALTDPLTSVFNRNVLQNLRLSSQDVAVMIDMDRFKKVNDKYGHEKGDDILKLLCKKSEENLRSGDFVVRYGGDEFLLVLGNCTKKDAVSIVERIRNSFEKEALPYGVTFSYGVERVEKGLDWALKKADAKMYAMKESMKKGARASKL